MDDMPQFLSSIKLYLLIVLLPQLVYLLTNSHGLASVCESCSPSTYIDLYLRLLRDPSSFSRTSLDMSTCTTHSPTEAVCTNTGDTSTMEYTEESVSVKGHFIDAFHDKTASSMCSCLSRDVSNLSTEEVTSFQSSDDIVGGGWYVCL